MAEPRASAGGLTALGGYEYQLVGSVALLAHALREQAVAGPASDALADLKRLEGWAELGDQDFVISGLPPGGDVLVVQLKYSRDARSLSQHELDEIDRNLRAGHPGVQAEPGGRVRRMLVTNRAPSAQVTAIPTGLELLQATEAQWFDLLCQFGRLYGLLPEEAQDRADVMLGRFLRRAPSEARVISLSDMADSFTGRPGARLLLPRHLRSISNTAASRGLEIVTRGYACTERHLVTLGTALLEYPVVLIEGDGGTGKSLALWQHAVAVACESSGPSTYQYSWSTRCEAARWPLAAAVLWGLRDPLTSGKQSLVDPPNNEDLADTVKRFQSALDVLPERAAGQTLLLLVDAVDEAPWEAQQAVRDLARHVAKLHEGAACTPIPQVALVVTARYFDATWMHPSGEWQVDLPHTRFRVGDFSDDEWAAVVDAAVRSGALLPQEGEALRPRPSGWSDDADVEYGDRSRSATATTLLTALRHPVVWSRFLALDPVDRGGALQQTDLRPLARQLVSWFVAKCEGRSPELRQYVERIRRRANEEHALAACLAAVARSTRELHSTHPQARWRPDTNSGEWLDSQSTTILYNECIRAGLITEDSRGLWRWRHQFVVEYLATLGGATGEPGNAD